MFLARRSRSRCHCRGHRARAVAVAVDRGEQRQEVGRAFRSASCSRTRSRPSAGCSSTRPLLAKALKAAGVTYSINNALNDPQKQKAQAQACLAAGAKVVIETSLDNGSAACDREAVHVEGRQGDRLRPPGDRRHGVRLRHLRRQGGRPGAGQRHHRRDEGEGQVRQEAASSPSSGAVRPTRTRSGSRAATTPSSTRSSRAAS